MRGTVATIRRRMASPGGEKPYRVYRGGRVKGRVPTVPAPRSRLRGSRAREATVASAPGSPASSARRGGFAGGARSGSRSGSCSCFFVFWAVLGYLTFRGGVSDANKRLPATVTSVLAPDKGSLLTNSTTILMLGTDHSLAVSRSGDRHSDSIMLLRTDPSHGRLYYLSIPRDLSVEIPGYGDGQDQRRLPGWRARGSRSARSRDYTTIPVNHVVVVNFAEFRDLIDTVGGIDVVVTRPILSKFDCPYASPVRCARWPGWRFAKGKQHLDGRRALIYSRIRKNQLDPAESDITRAERNQQVLQATMGKLAELRDVPADAVHRRRPDEAARRPTSPRTSSSRSAGTSSAPTARSTAGSAGSRPAATSRRARTTRR